MGAFTTAFHTRLANDSTLTELLSTFRENPAVFSAFPIPAEVILPYVIIGEPFSDEEFDCKVEPGREQYRDLRCYAKGDGSLIEIEAISERVRALFHNYNLPITGFDNAFICTCSGPTVGPDEENIYSRIVTVRVVAMEA